MAKRRSESTESNQGFFLFIIIKAIIHSAGRASAPDHFWPDYIDHLESELNPCNIVL
jgi:hypothetical protein